MVIDWVVAALLSVPAAQQGSGNILMYPIMSISDGRYMQIVLILSRGLQIISALSRW